ncbi:hypothetical protein GCM10017752_30550 [Streptomyces roseoviridis]
MCFWIGRPLSECGPLRRPLKGAPFGRVAARWPLAPLDRPAPGSFTHSEGGRGRGRAARPGIGRAAWAGGGLVGGGWVCGGVVDVPSRRGGAQTWNGAPDVGFGGDRPSSGRDSSPAGHCVRVERVVGGGPAVQTALSRAVM